MMPAVPKDCEDKLTDIELGELWHQLCVELLDTQYAGRTHGHRRTYDAGCQGPMCKKAMREHGRRRSTATPSEKYRYLDLIIEAWFVEATDRVAMVRTRLLEEIAPAS
jgi:hypothetical protein